jgi:hypothetical protein
VGTIERAGSGEAIILRARFLLGRSPACDLRVDEPRVSSEHARLRWVRGGWEVRDLGSKNGTFVGGRRLAGGERAGLVAGDTIALGGAASPAVVFVLTDASAPAASARSTSDGVVRLASGGILTLPDDDRPEVSLVEGRDGQWMLEGEGVLRAAEDGETIAAGGATWILDLPHGVTSTLGSASEAPVLEEVTLRFFVSRDEEHVGVTVVCPDREIKLPPRNYHYMLVTLARARLEASSAPPEERGWLDREVLCRMLATDELRLNVDVWRARKQLAELGIQGAGNLIERLARTGRMRLGVERVEVRREG